MSPEIVLAPEEYTELTALVRSKLTSVRLALRFASFCWRPRDCEKRPLQHKWVWAAMLNARGGHRARPAARRAADEGRCSSPDGIDHRRYAQGGCHWSTRTVAAELRISAASISLYWRAKGLKPHLVHGFKSVIRSSPRSLKTLWVCTLHRPSMPFYVLLYCDEKSQAQALDRTQPDLPLKKGRAATSGIRSIPVITACVLELSGHLFGYGVTTIWAKEAHLLTFSIAVDSQRKGWGERLLRHFMRSPRISCPLDVGGGKPSRSRLSKVIPVRVLLVIRRLITIYHLPIHRGGQLCISCCCP
jgi:hypothetical protein